MARKSSDPRAAVTERLIEALQALIADSVLRNETIARELGINLVDLQSLGMILRGAVSTPGELAVRASLPTSTATRILDRLEARDLIRREADPADRRKVRIVPARSPFEGLPEDPYAAIVANLRTVHARFSPEELETAARYLEALAEPPATGAPSTAEPR